MEFRYLLIARFQNKGGGGLAFFFIDDELGNGSLGRNRNGY